MPSQFGEWLTWLMEGSRYHRVWGKSGALQHSSLRLQLLERFHKA